MELLPEALAAVDARKRTMVKSIADLLQNPGDKARQMLAALAEDTKKLPEAQADAMSVMPEVAAAGRKGIMDEGMKVAGMFVGPSANLSKETRQQLLAAKELDIQKVPNEKIRQATGWFRGVDGNWKTEISDHASDVTDKWKSLPVNERGPEARVELEKGFYHPELYKLYPNLQNTMLLKTPDPIGHGSYDSHKLLVGGADKDFPAERSTILHELQHAIQAKERWAPGGSIFSDEATAFADKTAKPNLQHPGNFLDWDEQNFAGYRRLAGEVEARQTEARKDMVPSARMRNPPTQDIDVPQNEIIQQYPFSHGAARSDPGVDAAKAQLAPYQHQVFDRLYAATKDLDLSFTKTKELTNLMTGGTPLK